jgi:hypothetical protein
MGLLVQKDAALVLNPHLNIFYYFFVFSHKYSVLCDRSKWKGHLRFYITKDCPTFIKQGFGYGKVEYKDYLLYISYVTQHPLGRVN